MTALLDRYASLARTIASTIVRESFPQESDLFAAVWARFAKHVSGPQEARIRGLQMLGEEDSDFRTPFVIMTVAALLESLSQEERPSLDAVERAARSASESFGLTGSRLDSVVDAVTPKLFRTFSLLCGTGAEGRRQDDVEDRHAVWVEWWLDGAAVSPESGSYEVAASDERTLRADLVVDEYRGMLVGPLERRSFEECEWRALLGIWLAVDRTGRHFSYQDIDERRRGPDYPIHDNRALQKYVNAARRLLAEITGDSVIPRPKGRRYYIPAQSWSWCWIRRNRNRDESIILEP